MLARSFCPNACFIRLRLLSPHIFCPFQFRYVYRIGEYVTVCVRVCVRRADGLLAPVLIPRHTLIPLPLVHSGHSEEIVGSFSTRPVQSHLCLSINKIVCNINVARVTSTATHVR